ncbi:MAG: acetyl-CoA hydrolase/transferase family protein [Chlamydiae bacterium]|nr:acetyl-CoA hydrolase/transferase family protein [Chlamydiota bacterium]
MSRNPSAIEALSVLQSGMRVFIQGGAATPTTLLHALYEKRTELNHIELIHIHLMGPIPHTHQDFSKHFRATNLFVGANARASLNYQEIDYLPIFLSEIPALFREKKRPLDAALLHVSPPDAHGYCSLGTSVDVAFAASQSAPILIAQINKRMPRVLGDGHIHISRFQSSIFIDEPLHEEAPYTFQGTDEKIGHFTASLIEDGSTLQLGIGKIPSAVAANLIHHKDLGIHTEVWSDSLLPLIQKDVINNSRKKIYPGKIVSAFSIGTEKLYKFIHDNPFVVHLDVGFTNNPDIIRKNPKVVAINSAIEIDLSGQICADSIGPFVVSGVGGQIDYMRGSFLSPGGKSIIAMPSRTKNGISKIVSSLKQAAGVVTTRAHIHYVITEYGIADLYGKTIGERAKALINIAHPNDREMLDKQWREIHTHSKNKVT